jgi:hypothetical protein
MAGTVPAGLKSERRKFALTVGAAFVVLALVLVWRERETGARVVGGLGAALILAGLLIPGSLGPVMKAWFGLSHAISRVTTPIFMSVVYFLVITPIGLIRRAAGGNAMTRQRGAEGHPTERFWVERPTDRRRSDLTRQF